MPNALYCRDQKNWLVFDPASTGYPPTGFIITLPSLFDLLAELAGDAFKAFFRPEEAERTSPRATRNMQTLMQRLEAIGTSLAVQNDYTPQGDVTQTGFSKFASNEKKAILMTVELLERVLATFVDCRSDRQIYSDIYTGLLDEVDQRAVCAANLALAFRFDDALTVDPRPENGMNALEFLGKKVLLPFFTAAPITAPLGKLVSDKIAASDAKEAAKLANKKPPRVYMHPRTTNIWSKALAVEAGAVLVPTNVFSNDDSNVVKWMMIPFALALPAMMAIAKGSSFGSELAMQAEGDGTVPTASTNPPSEKLSNPFLSQHEVTAKVAHKDLACDADVYSWLSEDIAALVPDFLAT